MNPIIITGQTATGKTGLALQFAKKYDGYLISADSRQVYEQMDIGTGKIEDPSDLSLRDNTWHLLQTPIYGINLIAPSQTFSAGQFTSYAQSIFATSHLQNKLPIIIGGTGYYLKELFFPSETQTIPANPQLRSKYSHLETQLAEDKSSFVVQLQQDLQALDTPRFQRMNNSDANNPRRLIRAIEVAEWHQNAAVRSIIPAQTENAPSSLISNQLTKAKWIGLYAPKEFLLQRISQRVEQMFQAGLDQEITALLKSYSWSDPGLQTIGYIEWKPYFENKATTSEVKQAIITSTIQYARKQMIYLKRFPFIQWIDISQSGWQEEAIKFIN